MAKKTAIAPLMSGRRPNTASGERLNTGETGQHAPNNCYGRFSRRLEKLLSRRILKLRGCRRPLAAKMQHGGPLFPPGDGEPLQQVLEQELCRLTPTQNHPSDIGGQKGRRTRPTLVDLLGNGDFGDA